MRAFHHKNKFYQFFMLLGRIIRLYSLYHHVAVGKIPKTLSTRIYAPSVRYSRDVELYRSETNAREHDRIITKRQTAYGFITRNATANAADRRNGLFPLSSPTLPVSVPRIVVVSSTRHVVPPFTVSDFRARPCRRFLRRR